MFLYKTNTKIKSYLDSLKNKTSLKSILQVYNETILVFLIIFLSINIYSFLISLITSTSSFKMEFIQKFFFNFGKAFLHYLEISIIIVVATFIKKFLLKQRYSLSKVASRKLSIKVYSEIIVEKIAMFLTIFLLIFLSAKFKNVNFMNHFDYFSNSINVLYLLIVLLPIHCILGGIFNIILVHSLLPGESNKSLNKIKKSDFRFSVLLSSILPLIYIFFIIITPNGLKLFFDLIKIFFKT